VHELRDRGCQRRHASPKRSFRKYSTALTSWLVVRSIALTRGVDRRDHRLELLQAAREVVHAAEYVFHGVPLDAEQTVGQRAHLLGRCGAGARELVDQDRALEHGGERDGLRARSVGDIHAKRSSMTPPPRQQSLS
jgi:hypothetical protein